jgi:pimeloyl-ACP methyl ester carboxylesterase
VLSAAGALLRADSRNQAFDDFVTPLPIQPGETLVLGIVGGWERWDNPARCIRRTAIEIKRQFRPGVHVETVENHKLFLAEELIRRALDFDRDGSLSRDEAARARVILFGQSLGGRAVLYLSRTLNDWGVPVRLAVVVDSYGKDTYIVPPNVAKAANIFQRDHLLIKGAPALYPADPTQTKILYNRQVSYKNRKLPMPEHSPTERFFMDEHAMVEYDPELWAEVVRLITAAVAAAD